MLPFITPFNQQTPLFRQFVDLSAYASAEDTILLFRRNIHCFVNRCEMQENERLIIVLIDSQFVRHEPSESLASESGDSFDMYCLPFIRLFSMIDRLSSSCRRNALCSSSCICKLLESPLIEPKPIEVSSVFFRITHSVSSRDESNKAFQWSELDSSRFLMAALREFRWFQRWFISSSLCCNITASSWEVSERSNLRPVLSNPS